MDLKGYPKEMRHPQHVPASMSGYTRLPGGRTKDDPPGRPDRFPPVFVNNTDQEQYYASNGYLPKDVPFGTQQATDYVARTIGDQRPGLEQPPSDYPKWLYKLGTDLRIQEALVDGPGAEAQLDDGWVMDLGAVKKAQAQLEAEAKEQAARGPAPEVPQAPVAPTQAPRRQQHQGRRG